jgi:hypothetical protein
MLAAGARVYEGKIVAAARRWACMGLRMTADQRKRITEGEGIPPPLAESTVKEKGSSRPLVDTGQLWRALLHDVVMGGK